MYASKGVVKERSKKGLDLFSINCIFVVLGLIVMLSLIIVETLPRTNNAFLIQVAMPLHSIAVTFLNFKYKHLPLFIIMLPFFIGPIEAIVGRKSEDLRDFTVVDSTFITFIAILLMYPQVARGGLSYVMPWVFGHGLSFRVDMFGFIMLVTSGILWLVVTIYAHDYMGIEKHRNRFYLWMSITFGGLLGTIMAGDILTMFLFFEIMTFSSYMLVAHNQSKESILAGDSYIYMGVVGGLLLLLGIILLFSYTGTISFVPLASQLATLGWKKYLIIMLFICGFGIKAGMLPLHIWLPRAHPVAPTPASALLSGILIKVGAYGMLRVATSFFVPAMNEISGYADPLWEVSKKLGIMIIWVGIITMAVGVFMALQQSNMKKMLAYHSISQMGYIIMGIGVASYLGYKGSMGFTGSIYHIINHALYKGLLFMVVGLIYLRTKELNMYKLGGLWKKLPFTAFVCFVAILGITGMPGFNGFASKSILHHAIIEAYTYGHPVFKYAEMTFTIVSAGTVCSFIKLFVYVFLGKLPEEHKNIDGEKGMMDLAMGSLALMIIVIGQAPNYLLNQFIIPAARNLTYDAAFIDKYIVNMNFFNNKDLIGMVWVYLLGVLIFLVCKKFGLFHLHLPEWLSIENTIYKPMFRGVMLASKGITKRYEAELINSDVIIYTVVLTSMLFLLLKIV